jgi:hypothetical protein
MSNTISSKRERKISFPIRKCQVKHVTSYSSNLSNLALRWPGKRKIMKDNSSWADLLPVDFGISFGV